MNNKVVYTSLAGKYDELTDPNYIMEGWDYICFSNNLKQSNFKIWKIKKIPYKSKNKTILSRYAKLNPHIVLQEYDYSIYIDANIQIKGNYIYEKANDLIQENALISNFRHPLRDCIYVEAEKCIEDGRDYKRNILKLTNYFEDQGYPTHNGLFENGLIFRNHNHPEIRKLSEEWWSLYLKFSTRDQLSLCYLLWKNNVQCTDFMPKGYSTRNHSDFQYNLHSWRFSEWVITRLKRFVNKIG